MTPELELGHWQRRVAYLDHEAAILRIYGEHEEAAIYESCAKTSRGMVQHLQRELVGRELRA